MTAENYRKFLLNAQQKKIKVNPPVKRLVRNSQGQLVDYIDEDRLKIYNEVFSVAVKKEKSKKSE